CSNQFRRLGEVLEVGVGLLLLLASQLHPGGWYALEREPVLLKHPYFRLLPILPIVVMIPLI
ncbi:hypothetical protein KI387_020159, partial [Taxus chinensis]